MCKIVNNKTIYQDQRIAEEFCNFRCEYCGGYYPSEYSLNRDSEGNLKVDSKWYEKINTLPKQAKKYFLNSRKFEDFYNIAYDVMNKTKKILYADILKISGGELTTNKQLLEFVKKIHKNYYSIQILTNGLNLAEGEIKEFKKLGNINFQVSIDGVTTETNYARTHSELVTQRVVKNIESMIKEGIGVEINCVLTKYNTDKFSIILEKFKDSKNFIIVPRPVRGEPKSILNFSKEQALEFERIMEKDYEKYYNILPPRPYIDRLIEIMKSDKRYTDCFIPYFVQSIDGYGNFEDCPIGLITKINNNIFDFQNEKEMNIRPHIFKNNCLCKNCTNQYEMFNLYVEGMISKEELKKIPSLNSEKIIRDIDNIKEDVIKSEIKRILKEDYNILVEKVEKNEVSTDGNVYIAYAKIKGENVYSKLKYESGSHRVQRVPVTESNGRIQTSTATVLIMPEVEDVNIEINPNDLRIDTYCATGHGGQGVNTTPVLKTEPPKNFSLTINLFSTKRPMQQRYQISKMI